MHFFEKQRTDLIGQVGVSLQKILLFFMILSAFTLFNGGLLSFLICLIGFIGAVKRNPRMLMTYYTITIFFIVLLFCLSLASMATYNDYSESSSEYDYSDFSSSSVSSSSASASEGKSTHYGHAADPRNIYRALAARYYNPTYTPGPQNSTSDSSVSDSFSTESSSEYYYNDNVEWSTVNICVAFLAIFFYFFISYLKVKSLVLAYRMRKLILLASILPQFFDYEEESTPEHKQEPEQPNNKCSVEEDEEDVPPAVMPQQPYFTQPGFMPYAPVPMQYPGGPAMVPPPMMYGQYPVYYSFAPNSPQQDGKL